MLNDFEKTLTVAEQKEVTLNEFGKGLNINYLKKYFQDASQGRSGLHSQFCLPAFVLSDQTVPDVDHDNFRHGSRAHRLQLRRKHLQRQDVAGLTIQV